jgi:phospholipid transport system transporter-binding protein
MAKYTVEAGDSGHYRVTGELTFDTVPEIWARHDRLGDDGGAVTVDLAGVTRADSAGLVLLVEWLRAAQLQNRPIHFQNIPAPLLAIAKVSSLDTLLPLQ